MGKAFANVQKYGTTIASIAGGLLAALALFAFAVEILVTNTYNVHTTDPASGLTIYKPNISYFLLTGCFENTVHINNIGFHGPDVQAQKGKNVFRIEVLGSSYIEDRQVPIEGMFSTYLEQKLNAMPNRVYTYEVVPLGVGGNDTYLSTLYYDRYGSMLKPDLVINFETEYELVDKITAPTHDASGADILKLAPAADTKLSAAFKVVSRNSKLMVDLYSRYLVLKQDLKDFEAEPLFFLKKPAPLAVDEAAAKAARWKLKDEVVGLMVNRVKEDNAKFLYATWVIPGTSTSTAGELTTGITSLAAKYHFAYADLLPEMTADSERSGEPLTWGSCDLHWTPAGNQYTADSLFAYLAAHPALITK